jgi:hypothetical protein
VRGVRRDKVMASFIVLTLALGIGANAAMFGAVDRLLIRGPEHIADPARVMRLYRTRHAGPNGDVSPVCRPSSRSMRQRHLLVRQMGILFGSRARQAARATLCYPSTRCARSE